MHNELVVLFSLIDSSNIFGIKLFISLTQLSGKYTHCFFDSGSFVNDNEGNYN